MNLDDACDLVAHEAALLDARRFDEWLALFTQDAHYWVPLQGAAQVDPHTHNSLAYEDRLLLQLRVDRLKNPRAHSQHPASHCQHVLQRSRPEPGTGDGDELVLRTPFLYIETRGHGPNGQLMLAGSCRHRLVQHEGRLAIREKRIDLQEPGRPLPAIQLFI